MDDDIKQRGGEEEWEQVGTGLEVSFVFLHCTFLKHIV